MKCSICHLPSRGFEYRPKENWKKHGKACSMKHLKMLSEIKGMKHSVEDEQNAAMAGMNAGWDYCQYINKTDFAKFTRTEARVFAVTFRNAYTEHLAVIAENMIPF